MSRTGWGAVAAVVLAAGCIGEGAAPGAATRLATASGRVELSFPADWKREEESAFDVQASSKRGRATTGVFEFLRSDVAAHLTPHAVLELQVADMRSKRRNFVRVGDEEKVQEGDRTFTTVLWSGETETSRFHYRFTLIEFASSPELFLVVLQIAAPSDWSKALPIFDGINRSAVVRASAAAPG